MATDRSTNPKPRIHGRDHLPGGIDPIPDLGSGGGAPHVSTYFFSENSGDSAITVAANHTQNVAFAHQKLSSGGETGTPVFNNIPINVDCLTLEMLYSQWDGAGYPKACVLGTDSRIIEADQYALGNAGAGLASGGLNGEGDSTSFVRPNAHKAGDVIHAYFTNDDSASHDVLACYLVIFIWAITGYDGSIPGWPA